MRPATSRQSLGENGNDSAGENHTGSNDAQPPPLPTLSRMGRVVRSPNLCRYASDCETATDTASAPTVSIPGDGRLPSAAPQKEQATSHTDVGKHHPHSREEGEGARSMHMRPTSIRHDGAHSPPRIGKRGRAEDGGPGTRQPRVDTPASPITPAPVKRRPTARVKRQATAPPLP